MVWLVWYGVSVCTLYYYVYIYPSHSFTLVYFMDCVCLCVCVCGWTRWICSEIWLTRSIKFYFSLLPFFWARGKKNIITFHSDWYAETSTSVGTHKKRGGGSEGKLVNSCKILPPKKRKFFFFFRDGNQIVTLCIVFFIAWSVQKWFITWKKLLFFTGFNTIKCINILHY